MWQLLKNLTQHFVFRPTSQLGQNEICEINYNLQLSDKHHGLITEWLGLQTLHCFV